MAERPIIMGPESVRTTLDDKKWQTRRVIKPQPTFNQVYDWKGKRLLDVSSRQWCWKQHVFGRYPDEWMPQLAALCTWQPGDVLWVKETWAPNPEWDISSTLIPSNPRVVYKSDFPTGSVDGTHDTLEPWGVWKSPIFMPRWASRINLEVLSVQVDRLQDISIADALAEGIRCPACGYTSIDAGLHMDHAICINKWLAESKVKDVGDHSAIKAFAEHWDSINGQKYPWASNPWVFVTEFKRIKT